MITIKNLTIRNFLSIGNVTQAVNFDNNELTLILGENLDLGGLDNRNGVGKTTIIQALSYVLYGSPINNIRKDNLINRTNSKNMMVTVEFSVNGIDYKIERGRKPNVLKLYVDQALQGKAEDDKTESQGENKETQQHIEKILNMSSDMFKHIVALNTYTEPFLSMKASDQRMVIEQLLGITLLSEKAEKLKIQMKEVKDQIQLEEFRVKAVEEANKRVTEQVDGLRRRQRLWLAKHEEDLKEMISQFDELSKIDIEAEIEMHRKLSEYNALAKKHEARKALLAKSDLWIDKKQTELSSLVSKLDKLSHIDIAAELEAHKELAVYMKDQSDLAYITKTITTLDKTLVKDSQLMTKLQSEIKTLQDHKCYACGQELHDSAHDAVLAQKQELLTAAEQEYTQTKTELEKNKSLLFDLGPVPVTYYKTEAEAFKHNAELENLQNLIKSVKAEVNPFNEQVAEYDDLPDLGTMPKTYYDTEQQAYEHKTVVDNLVNQITIKNNEVDPYQDQLSDMLENAIQEISFDAINQLTKQHDHLKFLVDILTNKDSFVRKKIIDQNLSYLNSRLTFYLDKIGLPHNVVFKNDLSVEITELGRELDFHNLSRGEMNRLILSLSWAFRDVWENLYFPINVMFIDELLDNGTDSAGVESSLAILKDMNRTRNKSIWMISHKEELINRVSSVLKIVKENGFTTFSNSTETEE